MDNKLKTLCTDALGTSAPDDMKELVGTYHERLADVIYDYVSDCRKKNIEYLSSLGFLLARVQNIFVMAHANMTVEEKKEDKE